MPWNAKTKVLVLSISNNMAFMNRFQLYTGKLNFMYLYIFTDFYGLKVGKSMAAKANILMAFTAVRL